MGKDRSKTPHPRAAVSTRMSAEEFRALMGRSSPKGKRHVGSRAKGNKPKLVKDDTSSLPLEVTLPFLPPSVNSIYSSVKDKNTGKVKRVLSAKARKARKAIQTFVRGTLSPMLSLIHI